MCGPQVHLTGTHRGKRRGALSTGMVNCRIVLGAAQGMLGSGSQEMTAESNYCPKAITDQNWLFLQRKGTDGSVVTLQWVWAKLLS